MVELAARVGKADAPPNRSRRASPAVPRFESRSDEILVVDAI
jgi:hypothetical protein